MNIGKDLVAASATPLVLAILAEEECHGYAILGRVRELSGGALEWTDGMLYPVLHRLERQGFIRGSWGVSEAGRRRKSYRITEAGMAQLAEHRAQWEAVDDALRKVWAKIVPPTGRTLTADAAEIVAGALRLPAFRPHACGGLGG